MSKGELLVKFDRVVSSCFTIEQVMYAEKYGDLMLRHLGCFNASIPFREAMDLIHMFEERIALQLKRVS